jgi:dihydrofolate synthase/folylpolyglutamate synthase
MVRKSDYQRCLEEMYGLQRFGIKLGLDTIRHVLNELGNPHRHFACIHIAGTNGKGSVAATLASILISRGLKTGLYTSPHLVRFNERIQVNHRQISDEDVMAAHAAVRATSPGQRELTFFELATAMALYAFRQQAVDWAIIETGMGGRLDATNIIRPAATVITNVSIEHRQYLGGTLAAIAGEKAGIIKPRTPVVTGIKQPKALQVVAGVAEQNRSALYRSRHDFRTRRRSNGSFDYYGLHHRWKRLQTALTGGHQVVNAGLALATCEVLEERLPISESGIREGLQNTRWPGRLELLAGKPAILLDGAHNREAARTLADYLRSGYPHVPITLVVGILDDKPYRAMLQSLVPECRHIVVTRPRIQRALPPETLLEKVKTMTTRVEMAPDVAAAVQRAVTLTPADGVVCIAGSLYVVGEAKEALEAGQIRDLTIADDFNT